MRLEIKRLHNELQKTIVFVTHDQVEAMTMATRIAVMNGGVIQQIGTPDEIYTAPANLFVASFIGSPAMNMLPARIGHEGNSVVARHEPTGVAMDLSDYPFRETPNDGADVIVGLRPEHFSPGHVNGTKAGAEFALPVKYTETTGSDVTMFLNGGDGLISVRFDRNQHNVPTVGDTAPIHFPKDRFDVFDPKTERRL